MEDSKTLSYSLYQFFQQSHQWEHPVDLYKLVDQCCIETDMLLIIIKGVKFGDGLQEGSMNMFTLNID